MNTELKIGDTCIGKNHPVFVIGEVGLAHDGSLGAAHAYIDALAETGANAVKFQTHIAESESSKYEEFRVRVFPQDATRADYWKRTAFSQEQWVELAQHACELGLIFLSSPFSHEAVDLLEACPMPAWKVASGEVTNLPLLKQMAQTGNPILVSSGMSTWKELDRTVEFLTSLNASFGLFQCTTAYPCPPEKWGLNIIPEMIERYQCAVGLSDHSGTIIPSLVAKQMGASMLECHVVFHRSQFGPDSKASLTFEEIGSLVDGIRKLEISENSPVDKDKVAAASEANRQLFSKSLFATSDLAVGTVLSESDIAIRKPSLGVPAAEYEITIGRTVSRAITAGEPIKPDSLN